MVDGVSKREKALAELKAIYDDKIAEINGREYEFTKTVHTRRRQVFAFYSSIQDDIARQDFSFLVTPQFAKIEKLINEIVLFDGDKLSSLNEHWEEYPGDYIQFISVALGVVSYPFLSGAVTG
tara:strand:- start:289 stop:657 length:369 start_codon:yes stop_codon:yes gene_type:complete